MSDSTALTVVSPADVALALSGETWGSEADIQYGGGSVQAVPQSGRIPPLSLLSSTSKMHTDSPDLFPAGLWALGGRERRLVSSPDAPEGAIKIVVCAIAQIRLKQNDINAEVDPGKVTGAGFLQTVDGQQVFRGVTQCGAVSSSGRGLVAVTSTQGVGKAATQVLKELALPEDLVATNDCSRCLYGAGRCGQARRVDDRGFLPKNYQPVDKTGVVLDLQVPESLRMPPKDGCALIYRALVLVLAPAHEGKDAGFVPAMLTFRKASYVTGQELVAKLQSWGGKCAWTYPLWLSTETAKSRDGKHQFRKPALKDICKDATGKLLVCPKAMQAKCAELAAAMTPEDWVGFMDEELSSESHEATDASYVDGVNSSPAALNDDNPY